MSYYLDYLRRLGSTGHIHTFHVIVRAKPRSLYLGPRVQSPYPATVFYRLKVSISVPNNDKEAKVNTATAKGKIVQA